MVSSETIADMEDSTSHWGLSDKLAIALACLSVAVALILFWMDRTPLSAGISILSIAALMVYPIIHFAPSGKARIVALIVMFGVVGVFGWKIWPKPTPVVVAAKPANPDSQSPQHPDVAATPAASSPVNPEKPKQQKTVVPTKSLPTIKIGGDVKQGGN